MRKAANDRRMDFRDAVNFLSNLIDAQYFRNRGERIMLICCFSWVEGLERYLGESSTLFPELKEPSLAPSQLFTARERCHRFDLLIY